MVDGQRAVYFDGPAGSQVPDRVIRAVSSYLAATNANHGGRFATSRESDEMLDAARQAAADLLGTTDTDTIIFGPNMTTLTLALSRALARTWKTGDEVVVTRLDHDANVTPWVLAARDAGATVRYVEVRATDCSLDMESLRAELSPRTRLVAVGCASNAVGTVNPVGEICRLVHQTGGQVFLDAVHYVPHALVDVAAWDCDYLVCSAYKFFGPHVGILWGRRDLLAKLPAYKVRPAPDDLPGKWMTGTANHEGIAGTLAAIECLAELSDAAPSATARRSRLVAAYAKIGAYERRLAQRLIAGLLELPSVRIWGNTDLARLDERVPTVAVTHARFTPVELADYLGRRGIFAWHGHFYALPLTESLGLEPSGLLRIGLLHYNTADEIDRFLAAMGELEKPAASVY